jgi:serine/threonine protein kinase
LPFDDENVPNLFRKIKHGNFTLPGHLSSEAKDLIVQMLVVDPVRRITFAQIRKHVWFAKDLPEYLSVGQLRTASLEKLEYSDEVIQELRDLGLTVEDKENLTADERVAYQLLSDRASKQSSFSNLLRDDRRKMNELCFFDEKDIQSVSERYDQEKHPPVYKLTQIAGERSVMLSASQLMTDCPWQLGLEVSMEGCTLMTEVLHVLRDMGFEWYNVTPWRVRAQPVSPSQTKILLTIQVYKGGNNRYIVDVLTSQGPSLPGSYAALQFLRHLACNEAIAPSVLDRTGGFMLGHTGPQPQTR